MAKLKSALKKLSFDTFLALDKVGLHVLPKHYYTPVPDYQWLRANTKHWLSRAPLTSIHWDLDAQVEWLSSICRPYYSEVLGLELYAEFASRDVGPGYGPVESQVLHCFIRAKKPRTILEVGSGLSTLASLHADAQNVVEGNKPANFVCVEPFPRDSFRRIAQITHVEEVCQAVPSALFESLKAGDLLFIDSTHTVALGSDVIKIYLDIIPRLPAGVFIHIHDIYLPYLYHRTPMSDYFAQQETALLLALLTGNSHLRILACLSGLHYDRTEALKAILEDYNPQKNEEGMCTGNERGHFPSSIYLVTA